LALDALAIILEIFGLGCFVGHGFLSFLFGVIASLLNYNRSHEICKEIMRGGAIILG